MTFSNFAKLRKLKNDGFEICFMCESSRKSWLIVTPRFLMLVLGVGKPSSVGRWLDSVVLHCLVQIENINSAFRTNVFFSLLSFVAESVAWRGKVRFRRRENETES